MFFPLSTRVSGKGSKVTPEGSGITPEGSRVAKPHLWGLHLRYK